jgi:Tol biopolymer transport system component
LTFNSGDNVGATWTPDGKAVTFVSDVNKGNFITKRVDGGAEEVLHLSEKPDLFNGRWSPDGKWLTYQNDVTSPGRGDIFGIRPGIDSVPVKLVASQFSEWAPIVSPNGRFLAYASDETGQFEIYVVPFPNTRAAKWAVSTHGGTEPQWSHRGNELFYRDGAGYMVAAEVTTAPAFSIGRSTPLFGASEYTSANLTCEYAVAADDKRFLMIRPLSSRTPDKLMVVENWGERLAAKSRR